MVLPRTLVQGAPVSPKAMESMVPTVAGLPAALRSVPEAEDLVHVMAMPLMEFARFAPFFAEKATGDGVTVQTAEGTAGAGAAVRTSAAAAAPAVTAGFPIGFFMACGVSSGRDR